MSARPQFSAPEVVLAGQPPYEALLIAQLGRVHRELQAMLAIAAQMPSDEPYDTAFLQLRRDIDVLGRGFLQLSAKLLESHAPLRQEERALT